MLIARRAYRIVFRRGTPQYEWHKGRRVYLDLETGLPYVWIDYERGDGKGQYIYLTPCCYAAATASDPDYGLYCKSCFELAPSLCAGGPDGEIVD